MSIRRELSNSNTLHYTKWLYDKFAEEQKPFSQFTSQQIDQFKNKHVDILYPYKKVVQEDQISYESWGIVEIFLKLSEGSFMMGKSHKPDKVYESFGMGCCLYVKSIKHMAFFFSFISIMSIIATALCYWVAKCNGVDPMTDYQLFFMSGTVGSFGLQYYKCDYSQVFNGGQASFHLKCPVGQANLFGLQQSDRTMNSIENCRRQIQFFSSDNSRTLQPNQFSMAKTCNEQRNSCKINVQLFKDLKKPNLVYSYQCLNASYSSSAGVTTSRKSLFLLLVSFDLIFTIGFILFLFSQFKAQQEQRDYFKKRQVVLPDFTIRIKGFEWSTYQRQLQNFLSELIIFTGDNQFLYNIAQITIPFSQQYKKYESMRQKQYDNLRILIEKHFFNKNQNPNVTNNIQTFKNQYFYSHQDYQHYRRNLSQLIDNFRNSRYHKVQANLISQEDQFEIYFVFKTTKSKLQFMEKLQFLNENNRFFHVKDKIYQIKQPAIPDLILWENKGKNFIIRTIISWILTIVIILLTYLFFGYIYDFQNSFEKGFDFNIDCSVIFTSNDLDTLQPNLLQSKSQYLHCYCIQRYAVILTNKGNRMLCTDWLHQYWLFTSVPWLISIGFVLYSVVISQVFKKMTQMEGHKNLSYQHLSFTLKRTIILIINLDLVIILLNFHSNSLNSSGGLGFLFRGQYTQITPDWYLNVGIIVILTMIFNVFFPLIEFFLMLGVKFLRIIWDTRFFSKKTSATSKQQFMDFYNVDIFPIEERYAEIIAIIIICITFNSVIPLLNIIAALSLLTIYISDKLLMFLLYQKNHFFDERLHQIVCMALYLVLVIHLISTPLLFSQPSLYSAGNITTPSNKDLSNQWQLIFTTSYTIIYILILIGVLLFPIVKFTFPFWRKKFQKFKINQFDTFTDIQKGYDIINLLNNLQMKKLLVASNAERSKFQCLRNMSCSSQKDQSTMIRLHAKEEEVNNNGVIIQSIQNQNYQEIKKREQKNIDWQLIPELFGLPAYDERAKMYYVNQYMPMSQLDNLLDIPLKQSTK